MYGSPPMGQTAPCAVAAIWCSSCLVIKRC